MAQRWRTQIFSELNQDTVAKFADSVAMQDAKQSGNFDGSCFKKERGMV